MELYRFLRNGESEGSALTWGEVDRRARATAAELQAARLSGERVLLLFPPGLDFAAAFFGCLYAGVVAVPAYPPRSGRSDPRLPAIARDCRPAAALTDSRGLARSQKAVAEAHDLANLVWLDTGSIPEGRAEDWRSPSVPLSDLALLQYTSGSTATPKGVMVSHANLIHNQELIRHAFDVTDESVIVGWLPPFHDMGLIGNLLQPVYAGARCILMSPAAFLQNPVRWLQAISDFRATVSGGPNFAYDLCVDRVREEQRTGLDLRSWRVAFNGAEPVRARTLSRFVEAFGPCGFRRETFLSCYGLAEATLFVSGGLPAAAPSVETFAGPALERGEAAAVGGGRARTLVGCGRSSAEQEIAIVDPETGHRRSPGWVGEIWLQGPSVAQGYWNRTEETERTFRARLGDGSAGTFLRTGDLGVISRGELFVTGRLKDLVIVRGRNLYPQDLEASAETSHPALRSGGAAAFSLEPDADDAGDGGGAERLVVLLELAPSVSVDAREVAEAVRRAIAEEHEIGVDEVGLLAAGALPKTSSGKIRRHACRERYLAGELSCIARVVLQVDGSPAAAGDGAEHGEDGSGVEEVLLRQVRTVFGTVPSALDVPLTSLGLDSLTAIQLQAAIEAELGVSPSLEALFAGIGLRQLAEELGQRLARAGTAVSKAGEGPSTPGAPRSAETADVPLNWGQRGLWFLEVASPGNAAYHIALAARSRGRVDAGALRRALEELADRHPALRSTFHGTPLGPVQRFASNPAIELLEDDATGASERALRARLRELLARPFDLERGPLVRAALLSSGPNADVILLAAHHLIADLWSSALLLRDLAALYASHLAGCSPPVATPAKASLAVASIADHVEWQRSYLAGPRAQEAWDYWRERLGPPRELLDFPCDRQRPPVRTYRGSSAVIALPPMVAARLQELAQSARVSLATVLLASFKAFLHRLTHARDLLVGLPTAGSRSGGFADLVGYLVNPVVVRTDLGGDPAFEALLGRVRDGLLGALRHRDYPFPLLVERLAAERDPSRTPLFEVMLSPQQVPPFADPALAAYAAGAAGHPMRLGPLELEAIGFEEPGAAFDLMLSLREVDGSLRGRLNCSADLFDAVSIQRFAGWIATLFTAAAEAPSRSLSDLPLLASAEAHQVRVEWSSGEFLEWGTECLHELVEAQVTRTPCAVALVARGEETTYAELETWANRLARRLKRLGIGPESRVGVLLERSPALVASLLGVLKAGGAYVGLDPSYPTERLAFLLADAGIRVLVTRSELAESLFGDACDPAGFLRVDPLGPDVASCGAEKVDGRASPEHLAYLIYTSGSTGRPKGVAIEHRNAVARVRWASAAFDAGELAGVLASTSICFDLSVFELFVPLACGGTVILVDDAIALTRRAAGGETDEVGARARLLNTVPSAMQALLAAGWAPPGLRTVNLAGEPLTSGLAGAVHHLLGTPRLLNLYGPSEDTTYSTLAHIDRHEIGSPPIGRPLPGGRALVLDGRGELVPPGMTGELHLSGVGLARGYLDRFDQTAERFVPDPFGDRPGERLFRTGDLARFRHDGSLEFLGRRDHQVKVRGFRIELGEVEAAMSASSRVREAVAAAWDDAIGGRTLVAYVVPESPAGTAASRGAWLRRELAERLPAYMIPAAIVELPALPRTPNGKVDRRALPDLGRAICRDEAASEPLARTPIEDLLSGLWAHLLGRETIALDDDFFAIGGHSLLAVRAASRLREILGIGVPVSQLFATPTVASLARWISAEGSVAGELPAIEPVSRADRLPLSFSQERLWFLDRLDPGDCLYNMPMAVALRGTLDVSALETALARVAERHEALRTVFPFCDGEPVQRIAPGAATELWVVDLSGLPKGRAHGAAAEVARHEARRPFDLARGPLLRSGLVREPSERHSLLLTLHHAIADGWSLGVLARELGDLYRPAGAGEPWPQQPALPIQYADYAIWQRRYLQGEILARELDFWRRHLEGVSELLDLPADRPRPARWTAAGRQASLMLSQDLAARLARRGRSEGVTLSMVLLAACQALVVRSTGEEDFALGVPVAGRDRGELEPLIGCFVNLLVLRCRVAGDLTVRELLGRTRGALLAALEHQVLPFEKLIEELQPTRDLGRIPLVQLLVAYQGEAVAPRFHGLEAEATAVDTGTAKFDLTVEARQRHDGLGLRLEGSADLWDGTTLARLARHLRNLLNGLAEAAAERLDDLSLLSPEELHQIVREWNAGGMELAELAPGACLHEIFAAQVARTPDAVALAAADGRWTYRELAAYAASLAGLLGRLGVAEDDRVAMCAERSPALVGALLGILAAGGAYVPLDPSYPEERLTFMLVDSGARVLVTEDRLAAAFDGFTGEVVVLERIARASLPAEAAAARVLRARRTAPGNLAYVIYTSGSTGRPKGVAIEHRSAVELLRWARKAFSPTELAGVLASTSICFDLSIFELFVPLCLGGCAILAGSALDLPGLPESDGVTLVNTVPSAMAALVEEPLPVSLRVICLAGEALRPALLARIRERAPGMRVLNLYGPTEDTTYSTWSEVGGGQRVSIGRPLPGGRSHILDGGLKPVPMGVAGELYLAGAGLARGYLGRPELTAERFLPDPFAAAPGSRHYRTGDLVRQLPDGNLDFRGRADHQVKVRGFRIEPEEIEAAILSHAGVKEAAVVARETADGIAVLVAYVAASEGPRELRAFLRRRLPEFMVPPVVVEMPQLPRTPNGKVDRRALPAPVPSRPASSPGSADAGTATERELARIWTATLATERVGIHDDFFELGGHSLMLMRLAASYREAFAVDLPLRQLFEARTIAELGRLVEAAQVGAMTTAGARIRRIAREPHRVGLAADGLSPDPESLGRALQEGGL